MIERQSFTDRSNSMRTITFDDDLRSKLGDLSGEIALRDADGRVIAYVMAPQYREMMYDMAAALFNDAEPVDSMKAYREGRCVTTAEVLARLRRLEQPEKQRT
jgi:thymidine kinase